MSFDMFGFAVVASHNSCQDNTKMACNLDLRSYLSGQGNSLYMANANIYLDNSLSETLGDCWYQYLDQKSYLKGQGYMYSDSLLQRRRIYFR